MSTIADILDSGRVFLAPMAGVTEAPFRAICKRMGAALTYTEMVSATGLHYNPDARAAAELLAVDPAETPVAVQLFGADPQRLADAARLVMERLGDDVALIDLNMGCPVGKVVAKGEGSALMRDPALAASIVRAVVDAAGELPVTVKFRKGWDAGSVNAVEFALAMQEAGAAAIAVHGRTREQFYHGKADWDSLASVKSAVDIPVIGSGDVASADDVVAMLDQTGVDAVMVARGAQGNPWIFREARALLERGERVAQPSAAERIEMAREHGRALVALGGEHAAIRMRKHVAWYVHGLPGATHVRTLVNTALNYAQLDALLVEYGEYLAAKHPEAVA